MALGKRYSEPLPLLDTVAIARRQNITARATHDGLPVLRAVLASVNFNFSNRDLRTHPVAITGS